MIGSIHSIYCTMHRLEPAILGSKSGNAELHQCIETLLRRICLRSGSRFAMIQYSVLLPLVDQELKHDLTIVQLPMHLVNLSYVIGM